MTKFSHIPEQQLRSDLADAEADINICRAALAIGITQHRDGFLIEDRIKGNEHQIKVIKQELVDRGLSL